MSAPRASYRELVQLTGPWFLVLAFLARLPAAMGPLGVITLVVAATGSYGTAGLAAAAFGLGAAVGGPVVGTLADRYGQRAVGVAAAGLDALAYAALVGAVLGGHRTAVLPLAALAGFAMPQVGPLVRVRWAVLLGERGQQRRLPTAMAYEGAADEASFLAGPALVGVLALTGRAAAPLLVAAVLTLLAAIPFALHRTAPPVVRLPRTPGRPDAGQRLPVGRVAVLVAAMSVIGVVFGATQTAVTAFADAIGSAGSAGLIYAVLGVGSALSGLAMAWLPATFGPVSRYVAAAAALVGGAAALLLAGSIATAVVAVIVLGVTAAPYLISGYALAGRLSPPRRAGMVMTLLASGVVAGVSLGAAIAGRLADTAGYRGAFAVPLAAALLGLVLALLAAPRLRRALSTPEPAPTHPALAPAH
ncbi:MFS transporter [Catellatospora sp. TT07R-123]|uniref:MFS transporter n=1 Tax=Catellatospora sp. TT07R-123 TaxID=2733863 RepID=UPI001B0868F9|nr:MFS transporter [Catellatospora sp. TT07R-123]GHJ45066.1 MFS transporter [Catellatospora sp. TT07R-123]